MVTDPVCGMEVNPELCKIRETYKEYEYFFCSEACQKVSKRSPFELDPGIRDNGVQRNGGADGRTTHVDG